VERKTTRRWQLQDVLHAIGEEGITLSDYGEHTGDILKGRVEPINARLVGKVKTTLHITGKRGLPKCLTANERTYIWRAIYGQMRWSHAGPPTLQWVEPITCATQMKRSLEDRQVHPEDDRRYRTVTLRAQPFFQARPARDNVKVWIDEEPGGYRMYFAR